MTLLDSAKYIGKLFYHNYAQVNIKDDGQKFNTSKYLEHNIYVESKNNIITVNNGRKAIHTLGQNNSYNIPKNIDLYSDNKLEITMNNKAVFNDNSDKNIRIDNFAGKQKKIVNNGNGTLAIQGFDPTSDYYNTANGNIFVEDGAMPITDFNQINEIIKERKSSNNPEFHNTGTGKIVKYPY